MNVAQLFDLKGKKAVVTGASKGLGKSIALLLAEAGADVALIARDTKSLHEVQQEIQNIGRKAIIIPFDLSDIKQVPDMVQSIVDEFQVIDILVNNAGVNIAKPPEDITESDWDKVLTLNLKSVFFLSQTIGYHMKRQEKGKIINMSSQMAFVGYYNRSSYSASKGGLTQLTKSLAIEWASYNILVNAIAPTFVETEMTRHMFEDAKFSNDVLQRIPLGRLAKPEDLHGAVLFLASDSSNMVTGQTICVDGGWTVW